MRKKLHLYQNFLQQSEKTDEILEYVQMTYPDDQKLLDMISSLENLEEI